MAAVFEREAGVFSNSTLASRDYSIRAKPLTYHHFSIDRDRVFFQTLMKNAGGSWLQSALDEITLQTEQPAWSREGWAFGPIELDVLPLAFSQEVRDAASKDSSTGKTLVSNANTTLTTSAMRAQLQCDTVSAANSSWFVKNEVDLFSWDNSTAAQTLHERLNRTGYILPRLVFGNTTYQTTTYSRLSTIICCSNETDDAGRSAVGYWSHLNPDQWWLTHNMASPATRESYYGYGPKIWPPNFAAKWITGPTVNSNFTGYLNSDAYQYKIMQFTEMPEMTFLSCKPIIEQTNAKVTVAHSSGQVLDFELLGAPEPNHDAWAAHFDNVDENSDLDLWDEEEYTAKVRLVPP
jgi:hypothetical protein